MNGWAFNKKLTFSIISIALFVCFILILFQGKIFASTNVRNSIVKIYTVSTKPSYYDPWKMEAAESSSGSGCVIKGNLILTNAHVVSDQTFIQVRLYGKAEKYPAKVFAVSHQSDLAILTVDDPSFFKGVKPLKIGKLPEIQQEVIVYGFPKGGDALSATKGVISRIEHQDYAHSDLNLISAQIDAAINAGNSGGPVIADNLISGIVMQSLKSSQNIGYMVPVPVINHFLNDLEDGKYDGFPDLGILHQKIENKGLKKKYGLSDAQSGVLVTFVFPGFSADGKLQLEDVILSIEDNNISGDGTVEFRRNERTSFLYFVQNHQIGDTLNLNVFRKGEVRKIQIVLKSSLGDSYLVPRQRYDIRPSYYIYGGLIFMPLTKNYLLEWGKKWDEDSNPEFISLYYFGKPRSKDHEIVILSKVLPSGVNRGYHDEFSLIITHVDDSEINNLKIKNLIQIVERNNGKELVEFKSKEGFKFVLDRKKAEAELPAILKTYNIPNDRSEDFR